MEELIYDKANHWIDSVSVFLDLDSVIYIAAAALLVWLITRLIQKIRGKDRIDFLHFVGRYMILCSLLVFIPDVVMLTRSTVSTGRIVPTNFIICSLSFVYGCIFQLVFFLIYKAVDKRSAATKSTEKK